MDKLLAIFGALLALWAGTTMPLEKLSMFHLIALLIGIVIFAMGVRRVSQHE